jgi:signal peptidase I
MRRHYRLRKCRWGEGPLKRVVGLPGDEIAVQSNSLFVNGEQQTEPYLDPKLMDEGFYGPTNTPPGHVFVMGNNRANSSDSRVFGPVPEENIVGKPFLRLSPLGKL